MPRYALLVEYHGAPFAGWQRQTSLPSVQGAIEAALAKLSPGPHTIAAAGRTDAGVHATGQVAHCDLTRDWAPFRLSEALNFHLKPNPIAILDVARVDDEWHSRFSATQRNSRSLWALSCRSTSQNAPNDRRMPMTATDQAATAYSVAEGKTDV